MRPIFFVSSFLILIFAFRNVQKKSKEWMAGMPVFFHFAFVDINNHAYRYSYKYHIKII